MYLGSRFQLILQVCLICIVLTPLVVVQTVKIRRAVLLRGSTRSGSIKQTTNVKGNETYITPVIR